jgi:uncharacterized membrane protein YeaQ/YmgE (transglycosylase-associated protein family)
LGLFLFIIIGFFAGLIARAIMPGRQHMGLLLTTILGMVGSIVGGIIGSILSPSRRAFDLQPAGIILSIVGAFIVLGIYLAATKRHHRAVV